MKLIKEVLNGVLLFEPAVFGDERGYFFESFKKKVFDEHTGGSYEFVQDNESYSSKNVLRGLHFQAPPFEQGKLVRVVSGAALDVAVDIRKNSPTYGNHYKAVLSEENKHILWIPPGFAHGFVALKDKTRFLYKCTNPYNKASEGGLIWSDPDLKIDWGVKHPVVSDKDLILKPLKDITSPFDYV